MPALHREEVAEKKNDDKPAETDKKKKKPKIITLDYVISLDTHGKRNLYLARLGLNKPDEVSICPSEYSLISALQEKMKPDELKKFQDNEAEKIEKLQNPNYFVSKTSNDLIILHFADYFLFPFSSSIGVEKYSEKGFR